MVVTGDRQGRCRETFGSNFEVNEGRSSHIRPLVGVTCCSRNISGAVFHTVLARYIDAVSKYSDCHCVLIPARGDGGDADELDSIIDRLDGVLFTGGRSMVAPQEYGGAESSSDIPRDIARDRTTIPLVRKSICKELPVLAICRGLQELCCAFGGTLEPDLFDKDPQIDHRARQGVAYEEKYMPVHDVHWQLGGQISKMLFARNIPQRTAVNSLHVQGIKHLPTDMTIEALADDGLIEAASVTGSKSFAFGVQWHPEWFVEETPVNLEIFRIFGEACRQRVLGQVSSINSDRAFV